MGRSVDKLHGSVFPLGNQSSEDWRRFTFDQKCLIDENNDIYIIYNNLL